MRPALQTLLRSRHAPLQFSSRIPSEARKNERRSMYCVVGVVPGDAASLVSGKDHVKHTVDRHRIDGFDERAIVEVEHIVVCSS